MAVKHFKASYDYLAESTVLNFKKRYFEALSWQRKSGELQLTVRMIPTKKQGRPLLLHDLDAKVQWYIQALRAAGAPISTQIIQAGAEGILTASDRTLLVENGGCIALSCGWALS